jgi:hypothetical protein
MSVVSVHVARYMCLVTESGTVTKHGGCYIPLQGVRAPRVRRLLLSQPTGPLGHMSSSVVVHSPPFLPLKTEFLHNFI